MENISADNMLRDTSNIPDEPTIQPVDKENRKRQAVHGSRDEEVLYIAKLTEHAITPTRGTPQSAGLDLYAAYDYVIPAKGQQLCKTDIQIAVPAGTYGRVAPRSGLAVKHSIDVGAGVIDADYRGNVGVLLFNFGNEEFKVSRGDRIAQLILEHVSIPAVCEVATLDETERGAGGFGSTGK